MHVKTPVNHFSLQDRWSKHIY